MAVDVQGWCSHGNRWCPCAKVSITSSVNSTINHLISGYHVLMMFVVVRTPNHFGLATLPEDILLFVGNVGNMFETRSCSWMICACWKHIGVSCHGHVPIAAWDFLKSRIICCFSSIIWSSHACHNGAIFWKLTWIESSLCLLLIS